jgi:1-acyl-sn-glycerol-3-phosphate acyltransferase
LLERGDGVLLTPNHPDHSDCFVMFELGRRLRRPFFYMAAHQLFAGKKHWVLPRIGVFPVDREGASLTAFKTGAEISGAGDATRWSSSRGGNLPDGRPL